VLFGYWRCPDGTKNYNINYCNKYDYHNNRLMIIIILIVLGRSHLGRCEEKEDRDTLEMFPKT
jgi:hypothetical protein